MSLTTESFDLMVGVSTAQNTANVVPLLQLNVGKVLLIETSYACQKSWSNGCNSVLEKRGVSIQPPVTLDQQHSSRIDHIKKELLKRVEDTDSILFNLGGGQKAQQIAIWEVFSQRNHSSDRVCYANMANGKLEVWRKEEKDKKENDLFVETVDLDSPLTVEEILEVFGKGVSSIDTRPKNFNGQLYRLYKENHVLKNVIHGIRKIDKPPGDYEAYAKEKKTFQRELLWIQLPWLNKHYEELKICSDADLDECISQLLQGFVNHIKLSNKLCSYFHLPETDPQRTLYKRKFLEEIFSKIDGDPNVGLLSLGNHLFTCLIEIQEELTASSDKDIIVAGADYDPLPTGSMDFRRFAGEVLSAGSSAGYLFEEIFYDWFVNKTGYSEYFVDFKKNVTVKNSDAQDIADAEHDLLLATKRGTLVSIDAKTGVLPKKDLDARLHNLEQGGGHYVKFCLVVPLDQELYAANKVQLQLLETVFKFHQKLPVLAFGFDADTLTHPGKELVIPVMKPEEFFRSIS